VLIDSNRTVSLSRYQSVLWSVIVLSAYFTMAMRRIHLADPLGIAIDWHLWALMGISTTSLVGTPLLQAWKKGQEPADGSYTATASALDQPEAEISRYRRGLLYVNTRLDDAAISDMFSGDEVGNAAYVDLGKVQMYFFTMVTALIYCVLIYQELETKGAAELSSFPALTDGMIAALGLSHSIHLGTTATRDTPTKSTASTTQTRGSASSSDVSIQKILDVVNRIDRTTFGEAQTSKQILDTVNKSASTTTTSTSTSTSTKTASTKTN
jgi:hypothetical protein